MKNFAAAMVVLAFNATANAQLAPASLCVEEDGHIAIVNISDSDLEVTAINLNSVGGFLAEGEGNNRFGLQIPQLPGNVAMATLGTTVTISDSLTLPYVYTGDIDLVATDMAASEIAGTEFNAGPLTACIPEPATGLLAAFGALGLMAFRRRK